MLQLIARIFSIEELRKKILFTVGALIVYRFISHISVPGVDLDAMQALMDQSQVFGAFSLLTWGQLQNFSIVLMGLAPYINAVIIMQLLTVIVPSLERLQKEGDQGRRKISQYTRYLTVPLALLQSYGMVLLMNSQMPVVQNIQNPSVIVPIILTVTAGTIFLMWLWEIITEKGIGNGISLIIMTGIISSLPSLILKGVNVASGNEQLYIVLGILGLVTIALTVFVVIVSEARRQIPLSYAGRKTSDAPAYFPMRINQAGMIPIIFATSLIMFPSIMASFFVEAKTEWIRNLANTIMAQTTTSGTSWSYVIALFLFIVFFTFFYVSITFRPDEVSDTLQKRGAYITGVRPGKETASFLHMISSRLNFSGGLFLGFVATLPLMLTKLFSEMDFGTVPFLISGSSLIIIVGVVLDLIRQINGYLTQQDYEKL